MAWERILVTVMTYPVLSRKYGELVCTAGIREDGSWVRIHPVPLRRLGEKQQYSKFDWIELKLVKSRGDRRPESYAPADLEGIRVVGNVGTEDNWRERRKLLLKTAKVYDRLQLLVDGANANTVSLAVFKLKRALNFDWNEGEPDWNAARVEALRNNVSQGDLFDNEHWKRTFELIPKLPYDFNYQFTDKAGDMHERQVLDWELGEYYWECDKANLKSLVLPGVHKRYFYEFRGTDLHFILGTLHRFPSTWVIVGVLPIPHEI